MSRRIHILIVAVFITLSLLGFYRLMSLEFETGEAYPRFSTYRVDPLGTMALFESIDELDQVSADRNTKPLDKVTLPSEATLVLAGAGLSRDAESMLENIETFVDAGGRLAILFRPFENPNLSVLGDEYEEKEDGDDSSDEEESNDEKSPDEDKVEEETDESEEDESALSKMIAPMSDISERWGFRYGEKTVRRDNDGKSVEKAFSQVDESSGLPERLAWQSDLYFRDFGDEWSSIYAVRDRTVVMERAWGDGSIVLVTDNFHVTNEAMLETRRPGYLAWLIGNSDAVIFDETHLGISPRMGLMGLMVHYRLGPVLLVCLLLSGLFVWKSTTSLVPAMRNPFEDDKEVAALGAVEGLARLAKRSLPRSEVMNTCWSLFQNIPGAGARLDKAGAEKVREYLKDFDDSKRKKRDLAATYNAICSVVNERKKFQ